MAGRNPSIYVNPGDRFGRLVIREETRNNGRRAALCDCECGKEKVINLTALTSGAVTSCGCLRSELAKTRAVERNKQSPPRLGTGTKYRITKEGRECAGHYCGNTYKLWEEFNKGNAAQGYNSWCRDCTKAHYAAKQLATNFE